MRPGEKMVYVCVKGDRDERITKESRTIQFIRLLGSPLLSVELGTKKETRKKKKKHRGTKAAVQG